MSRSIRTSSPPRLLAVVFAASTVAAATFAIGSGCSFGGSPKDDTPLQPFDTNNTTEIILDVPVGDDSVPALGLLCGSMDKCVPDDPSECVLADGGVDDAPTADADATDGSATKLGCRVVHGGKENVLSACAPAGLGVESSFCSSDADCAPGLGCVGNPGSGICLKFCCKAASPSDVICPSTHYCTPLPLAAPPYDKVPVCAKLDNCTLLEEPSSKCTATKSTCTVVRNDGGTTCVPVGSGGECDDCKVSGCQANHACVGPSDNRRCRKLCHAGKDIECTPGRCEGVPTIPTGFGLCTVGADAGCK